MVLSDFTKGEIIGLYKEKYTQTYISNKLGVSQSTVSRTIKKYLETGKTDNKPCLGAKRSFDSSVVNTILQISSKNPKCSLRKIASEVQAKTKNYISHVTVGKILNDNNLFAYSPIKKPLLSKKNILSRVEKTGNFICMSKDKVKTIIFSDESKFNLYYSDGKCSVWRPPSTGLQMKYLTPTVKFGGGSVMVWGCFSYYGVGKLVFIDGKMDAVQYVNILADNLDESAAMMGLGYYTFQQDNDPKHTAKLAKKFFTEKNVDVLIWPAQSPDLNPIESLWEIIKSKVAKYAPKSISDLKAIIEREWYATPIELCQKLALSFKGRSCDVYRANGGHINY